MVVEVVGGDSERRPGCNQSSDSVLSESISRRLDTGELAWKDQGAHKVDVIGVASYRCRHLGSSRIHREGGSVLLRLGR